MDETKNRPQALKAVPVTGADWSPLR